MKWGRPAWAGLGGGLVLAAGLGSRVGCGSYPSPNCDLGDLASELASWWPPNSSDVLDSAERWLFGAATPVLWLALGTLLAAYGVLVWFRRDGSLRKRFNGPTLDSDPEAADARVRRQSRRRARALARQGEIEEAAELSWRVGDCDAAAEYFVQADRLVRAAEVRQHQTLLIEAAGLFERAGDFERAAGLFAQEREWELAAGCYQRLGRISVAAEMHEKAGNPQRAADCYDEAEFHTEAARLWGEVREWERAAASLERVLFAEAGDSGSGFAGQQARREIAVQAAEFHRLAGRPEKGGPLLESVGCWLGAAEIASSVDDHATAARAFHRAGDSLRAAEAFQQLGEEIEAARLLGEYYRDRNELEHAAGWLERAGDHGEAGDLYRQQGEWAKAADCYEKQRDWAAAAEMRETEGDLSAASACYEEAGAFEAAACCYARLGQVDHEADCLVRAGAYLRAAQVYQEAGREESAIAALQKIEADDETLVEGTVLLARLFCRRDQPEYAIRVLEAALGDGWVDRARLPAFYGLACALEQSEHWDHCIETLEKILSLDIDYGDAEEKLIRARKQLETRDNELRQRGLDRIAADDEVGRYRVRGELGRGGMGIVHEAFDSVLDRRVAFKVLPGGLKNNAGTGAHFLREAKAAAKLNHPHIVTVYDAGEQGGRYYIAMELVDGVTFKQILKRRGPLAPRSVLYVALQLCDALAYAHEKRVVHRDIKPANIMWTRNKQTKVMDFGLAKLMEEVRCQTSVVAGTPYYMSPEQTLGKNVDHRTDIYALGVTLFEMVTGKVPFDQGDISYHHMHTPAPDVRDLTPVVEESIALLIGRCLAKDPAARFVTAREMLDHIRRMVDSAAG